MGERVGGEKREEVNRVDGRARGLFQVIGGQPGGSAVRKGGRTDERAWAKERADGWEGRWMNGRRGMTGGRVDDECEVERSGCYTSTTASFRSRCRSALTHRRPRV